METLCASWLLWYNQETAIKLSSVAAQSKEGKHINC